MSPVVNPYFLMMHEAARRRGVTLIEVVLASVVIAIVMATAAGVLVLTARAMDNGRSSSNSRTLGARAAVDRISDDLKVATAISEQTPNAVTLIVPDRTGDGQPETLRYAWSGVSGDPLTLSVNGSAAQVIAKDVRAFDLTYLTRTVGKPPPVESNEQLLMVHDGTSIKGFNVKNTTWAAEYFLPAFPSNTLSWKITRIVVEMKRAGATAKGIMTLQVRLADSSKKPRTTILDSSSVDVTTVPTSFTWVEFPFTSLGGLDPSQAVCVVMTAAVSTAPGAVCYDDHSTDTSIWYTTTTNTGASWATPKTGFSLQMYVYGTYTMANQ